MNLDKRSLKFDQPGLILALLTTIISLVVNLASTLYGPGHSVSYVFKIDLAPVAIVPSSYSLALWGLVYLALLAYFAYQVRIDHIFSGLLGYDIIRPGYASRNSVTSRQFEQINRLLILIGVAQIVWCWLFSLNQFALAILPLVALLVALIRIYASLGIGLVPASRRRRRFCHSAFSIYLAWAMMLTAVTTAAALYDWGWHDSSGIWAVIVIITMVLVNAVVITHRRDVGFTLTVVWSLVMIGLNHSDNTGMVMVTGVGTLVLLSWLAYAKRLPETIAHKTRDADSQTTFTMAKPKR